MGYRFSQQTYSFFFSRCCVHVWCVEKAFNLTWESWREIDYMYSDLCKLTQLLERCVYIGIQSTWLCTVINYKLLWGMFLLTLKLWDVEYVLHWGGGRSSLCFFFQWTTSVFPVDLRFSCIMVQTAETVKSKRERPARHGSPTRRLGGSDSPFHVHLYIKKNP